MRLAFALAIVASACSPREEPTASVEPPVTASATSASASVVVPSASAPPSAKVEAPVAPPPDDRPGAPLPRKASSTRGAKIAAIKQLQTTMARTTTKEVHDKDNFEIVLEPTAQTTLPKLKDATIAFVQLVLDEIGPSALSASSADLSATLDAAFNDADMTAGGDRPPSGTISERVLLRIDGHAKRIAASFSIEFGQGGDDVLVVFESKPEGFVPVLVRRKDGYKHIGDARWASSWAVSPEAADGSWFVVDANSHAWISSLWRGIDYGIYEPGPDASHPQMILSAHDSAFIGEEVGTIGATVDTAEVSYASWDVLGSDHSRTFVRNLRRTNSNGAVRYERVAPFVWSPRELVPELQLADEALARQMAAPGAEAAVMAKWQLLHGKSDKAGRMQLVIVGQETIVDASELKSPATVRFTCEECVSLPKRLEIVAEKIGDSWLIRQ